MPSAIWWSVRPAKATLRGSLPTTVAKASSNACRPWPAESTSVPSMSQSTSSTAPEPGTLGPVFGALTLPPRLVMRALDDLHTLAEALRELTEREGDLSELVESVKTLPRVEDELSASVQALQVDVRQLHQWLQPLHAELTDLDETAEALEKGLAAVNATLTRVDATIAGLHGEIEDLRGRIPGLKRR